MSHLTLETLARLVDEAPDAGERAHLEACALCRAELEDLRADAATLAGLPAIEPPDTEWPAVRHRLEREGLIQPAGRVRWTVAAVRAAAAIALFLLGGIAGAAWRGEPGAGYMAGAANAGDRIPAADALAEPLSAESPRLIDDVRDLGAAARGERGVRGRLVGDEPRLAEPRTADEVALYLRQAEARYFDMLTRYAELAARTEPGDPIARLAALESIVLTTRAALGEAPADPVINGYHLTALAQREATIRQIAATGDSWF